MPTTQAETINADLPAFLKQLSAPRVAQAGTA
jgi:hypothetical protein